LKKQTIRISDDFASLASNNIHSEMPLSGTSMDHGNPWGKELFNKVKSLCNAQTLGIRFAHLPVRRHLILSMRKDFIAAGNRSDSLPRTHEQGHRTQVQEKQGDSFVIGMEVSDA